MSPAPLQGALAFRPFALLKHLGSAGLQREVTSESLVSGGSPHQNHVQEMCVVPRTSRSTCALIVKSLSYEGVLASSAVAVTYGYCLSICLRQSTLDYTLEYGSV